MRYRAITIYDTYIASPATKDYEKLAVSEFNAVLIATSALACIALLTTHAVGGSVGARVESLMNDFRVNPERPCKRSSSFHARVRRSVPTRGFLAFFSLSLFLAPSCGAPSYLSARFIL